MRRFLVRPLSALSSLAKRSSLSPLSPLSARPMTVRAAVRPRMPLATAVSLQSRRAAGLSCVGGTRLFSRLASTAPAAASSAEKAVPRRAEKSEMPSAGQIVFDSVWKRLEDELGVEGMSFPSELLLLGGAPASGKGTNTDALLKERGITAPPVVMSALLCTPEMRALKDAGMMVGDSDVVELLFRELLKPEYKHGAVVDGFPRTKTQVEVLRRLYDRLLGLRDRYQDHPTLCDVFTRPVYRIVMLYVDERTSVERQTSRGRAAIEHNKKVEETGEGELIEVRPTDVDVDLCKRRYATFKSETFDSLESLRDLFHYHFVDANGPLDEVQANITKELAYQSQLELDAESYDVVRAIPTAETMTMHSRQKLVTRLNGYAKHSPADLAATVELIQAHVIPEVARFGVAGRAHVVVPGVAHPEQECMLIDVLAERGFHTTVIPRADIGDDLYLQIGWKRGWRRH